jgi:hypothetical protein
MHGFQIWQSRSLVSPSDKRVERVGGIASCGYAEQAIQQSRLHGRDRRAGTRLAFEAGDVEGPVQGGAGVRRVQRLVQPSVKRGGEEEKGGGERSSRHRERALHASGSGSREDGRLGGEGTEEQAGEFYGRRGRNAQHSIKPSTQCSDRCEGWRMGGWGGGRGRGEK